LSYLLIPHDAEVVAAMADTVLRIERGRIATTDGPMQTDRGTASA
jgi:ABC-type microcin C transport system duplicated ATPase subunit YejF